MICMKMLEIKFNEDGEAKWRSDNRRNLSLIVQIDKNTKIEGGNKQKIDGKFNFLEKKFKQIKVKEEKIQLEFKVVSSMVNYGKCSSFLVKDFDRVDCMNLVDSKNKVIGGLLYEATWPTVGPSKWINGRKDSLRQPEPVSKQKKEEQQEGFFGFFSCFSSKGVNQTKKNYKQIAVNKLIPYEASQLQANVPTKNDVHFFVQYYSTRTAR